MYSILLVEDEKMELDTLKDYINWEKLSVDKVYTARNGRSAYECIIQNEPDIMITDIQMPIMTGTELAKRIREEGYKTKIIFLTGYDDFEYVKEAFRVEAIDYILKPFMTEDVEKLIIKVQRQIDSERKTEKSIDVAVKQMVEQLCKGDMNEEDATGFFSSCSEDSMGEAYGLLAVYGVSEKDIQHKLKKNLNEVYHSFFIGDVYIVLLYKHIFFFDGAKRIQSMLEGKHSIIYYKEKISIRNLKEKTDRLRKWTEWIFFETKGEIFEAERILEKESIHKLTPEEMTERKDELCKVIKNGEIDLVESKLRLLVDGLVGMKKEEFIGQIYAIWYELKKHFVSGEPELTIWMSEREEEWEQNILRAKYLEDIIYTLHSYCTKIATFFQKQQENPNYHVIMQIKDYLEHNYSRACSVEEIAKKVHLSPNYIRTLFKESVGQTILEYVTEFRLLKACELLKDKTLRVKEVGRLVGYDNESYFGTVFAKKYGVSPNEYRKMV